jgi:hypothetical protein
VTEGDFTGISFGGLASVTEGYSTGISIGGLASVSEEGFSGISVGGLAAVAGAHNDATDGEASGIMLAGLACVAEERLMGLGAAGWTVRSDEIRGAAFAGARVKAYRLHGLSAAVVNQFEEYQIGLSIGIVNIAERLNGIQLGIINIAKNNPSAFRALPIINAHFD